MTILIAEDDDDSRRVLEVLLRKWGYEPVSVTDGRQALEALQSPASPPLAILDWMMPYLDGVDVIRTLRESRTSAEPYVILLTARTNTDDIAAGLVAGANDYVTKPFNHAELRARVGVGERMVELQGKLNDRVRELQEALDQVKQLQGMLPICTYCKKIRDDQDYWHQVESYIAQHSEATFSHGICPDCFDNIWKPRLEEVRKQRLGQGIGNSE